MSKAFTRESDDGPERPTPRRPLSAMTGGGKSYLTWDGAQRIQSELDQLRIQIRTLNALPSPSLAEREQSLQLQATAGQLEQTLSAATVVQPPTEDTDRVRLGAWVQVQMASGDSPHFRIVGVDEVDLDRGWISHLSPLAKALLNARQGDQVRFRFPQGEQQLHLISVSYSPPAPDSTATPPTADPAAR